MTTIGEKVRYVQSQGQTRDHTCHWPGCDKKVPPAKWGCRPHWMALPMYLRDKIWRAYRPGQEKDQSPSKKYVAAAREVQEWIAQQPQFKTVEPPCVQSSLKL